MHFASSKSFFSSDQLPLTAVDDSGTRRGCNPQQTEMRKTLTAHSLVASRTGYTLIASWLQQLWSFDILPLSREEQDRTWAYSCSRG